MGGRTYRWRRSCKIPIKISCEAHLKSKMYKFLTLFRIVTATSFAFSLTGLTSASASKITQDDVMARVSSPQACLDFLSRNQDIEYGWIKVPLYTDKKQSASRLQFYYQKKESSPRQIKSIFINGGPIQSSHSSFELVKSYVDGSVLFFDQRGTGCSEKYSEASSINEFGSRAISRDITHILDRLEIDKVIVIGHSYGAKVAQRFVTLYPKRVAETYTYADFALSTHQQDQFPSRYNSYKDIMDRRRTAFAKQYPQEDKKITFLEKNLPQDHCIADIQNAENILCGVETIFVLNWWLSNPNSFKVSAEWVNYLVQENKINFENLYKFTTRNSFKNYSVLTAAIKEKEFYFKSNIDECLKVENSQAYKLSSLCLQIWPLMRWQTKNNVSVSYDPVKESNFMQALLRHPHIKAHHYIGLYDSRTYQIDDSEKSSDQSADRPHNFQIERIEYGHWEYLATTSFWSKILAQ